MKILNLLLAVGLLFCTSCTHVYTLQGFNADSAQLGNAKNKKVAIIFSADKFARDITIAADGHTFIFQENDRFYKQAYSSALMGGVASTDFHTSHPGPGYDVYLYPGLSLEISTSFTTKTCKATYSLEAKDAQGARLALESKSGTYNFVVIANADNACKIAMLNTFDDVTYPVFKAIDG